MKLRSAVFALALIFGLTGFAEAAKKPHYAKHNAHARKAKVHKYNAKQANKRAAKLLAKQRKRHAS